jgi:DNA-binding GntR family transcriptional regulator
MLGLKPEHRASIARELHWVLRQRILSGELLPGHSISEVSYAEQLGVSRTPVREVFRRLADEGLLEIRPQIGTFVAPIPLTAVYDSQFVRETLECRTIRLAVERATPADDLTLRQHLERQRPAVPGGDYLAFFPADDAMHAELIRMAGREAIWTLIQNAKSQLDRVRYLSFESRDWLGRIFEEHEQIIARVIGRDADGAETMMRSHLRTVFAAIERLMATKPYLFAPGR